MKHTAEMGSVAMTYKFLKDWFRHSKVYGEDTQTHRQYGGHISLL
jgi:hypothetical protein